jgi:PTS system ascorbate-specific IIB component
VAALRILTVCGMGVGSSLILRMQAEKALKRLGVVAELSITDIGSARGEAPNADYVITSPELAERLDGIRAPIVTIVNFIDLEEMVRKFVAAGIGTAGSDER